METWRSLESEARDLETETANREDKVRNPLAGFVLRRTKTWNGRAGQPFIVPFGGQGR
jgi:hypothetical protein